MSTQNIDENSSKTSTDDSLINSRRRIAQNFLLIWIDFNTDHTTEDCQIAVTQLRSVVNDVNVFITRDEAIDFLTENHEVKVFLIVDNIVGEQVAPLIHDIPQLDSIYIFCAEQIQHEQWTNEWIKIRGVYADIISICPALDQAAKQCDQDLIPMSFITVNNDVLNQDLNQLEPSYMYSQIFKEILLDMNYDEQSIKDLANYCREFYREDTKELQLIKEFEDSYRSKSPIWWYTRQCFTYQMLNRALRTLEGDTIIHMGFFICDLHQQLQKLYQEQISTNQGKPFIVYRGQGLLQSNFEKLQKTKGGLISFNNFLSTSNIPAISRRFAENALTQTNMVGVLFQMSVDPSLPSTPFACIRDISYFKNEEEVLFSMHAVFRVDEITQIENNKSLYQVDLTLTTDDDQELRILTQRFQQELTGEKGWNQLGQLLLKLSQLGKAEKLYNALLKQTFDDNKRATCYNNLGCIKDQQGDYKMAIEYYEKSLEIRQNTLPPNHPDLATSYSNIGSVYYKMGEYSKALSFLEKALEIFKKTLSPNHPDLATSYNSIGLVYDNMGEYSKALSFLEKALEIFKTTLPPNHPDLATSYSNIGLVYDNMREYSKALSFHEKALEIRQKTLPPNHPLLASSYSNIGSVYYKMGEYSKALSFLEKALEIRQETLSPNHPDLATSYSNIAGVYKSMGEYSKALSFYEKELEIFKKTLPPNHPLLATSYSNISLVYYKMGEYSKALSIHEKALEIQQKTLPPNHPDLATSYNNIAGVYYNMGEYSKALSFLEKALEIRQKTLSPNHPDLATSYNNIAGVYKNMGEYSKALSFHEKALEIQQKTLPPNHPDLAISYNNIGSVYKDMGHYSKAHSYYERALIIMQSALPANHPNIQTVQENINILKKSL